MEKEDRIKLRDELFKRLKEKYYIYLSKNSYRFKSKNDFIVKIENDTELKEKYYLYIQQFRSEEEALYCLLHQDDFENHKCVICNKICEFYFNKKHKEYRDTCSSKKCSKQKTINTCLATYGTSHHMQNKKIKKLQEETMLKEYGSTRALQVDQFKNKSISTYHKNHDFQDKIINDDIFEVIQKLQFQKEFDLHLDIYHKEQNFIEFIKYLHKIKNRKLHLNEIVKLFKRSRTTIKEKLKVLNLLQYFDIRDSDLELKFNDFLIDNNFKEDIDFERHNRSILNKNQLELDFYLKDYNIAFEINDIHSHNTIKKDKCYHYNKTIECTKKGIYLIHLWEWELIDEELWRHISNWILNLLNNSKIQLDIKDCIIKEVPMEECIKFYDEYSIDPYIQATYCIGLYCNNELIEILLLFQNNILDVVVKFGYNYITNIYTIMKSYMAHNDLDSLITYIDIAKSNVNNNILYNMKFELLKYIGPKEISYNNECRKIYDCGKNVYILERE